MKKQKRIELDKHYKSKRAGKRVSKKYAIVPMRGGGSYRRRNANQYMPDGVDGGGVYYENHTNRSDKDYRKWYAEGGNTKTKNYAKGGGVWTSEQRKKVEQNDIEFEKYLKKMGINPNSKEASVAWREGGFQKNQMDIFGKKYEYEEGGNVSGCGCRKKQEYCEGGEIDKDCECQHEEKGWYYSIGGI